MKADVASAVLLADPSGRLTVAAEGTRIKVRLPSAAPDKVATVVRLNLRGVPVIDPALKTPPADGAVKH